MIQGLLKWQGKVFDFDEAGVREMHFRVKLTTQLGKLKKTWGQRTGAQVSSLRFMFKTHHINDDDTPETLKMKDGDIIEVYMSPR